MSHPSLKQLMARPNRLKSRMLHLLAINQDQNHPNKEHAEEDNYRNSQHIDPSDYSLHGKHAFYKCEECEKPYYGGRDLCLDSEMPMDSGGKRSNEKDKDDAENKLDLELRLLCQVCRGDKDKIKCRETGHEHFWVYKCRLCCRKASVYLLGGLRLCDSCYDNSAFERLLRAPEGGSGHSYVRVAYSGSAPVCECIGSECPMLKEHRPGDGAVSNVIASECESVLYCGKCTAALHTASSHNSSEKKMLEENRFQYSLNILENGNGEQELAGWKLKLSTNGGPGCDWSIVRCAMPGPGTDLDALTAFAGSYEWCERSQLVDLAEHFDLEFLETRPSIAITAYYGSSLHCGSLYALHCEVLDGRKETLLRFKTGELEAPIGKFAKITHTFVLSDVVDARAQLPRYLRWSDRARDLECWKGHFGARVTGCSVYALIPDDYMNFSLEGGKLKNLMLR